MNSKIEIFLERTKSNQNCYPMTSEITTKSKMWQRICVSNLDRRTSILVTDVGDNFNTLVTFFKMKPSYEKLNNGKR